MMYICFLEINKIDINNNLIKNIIKEMDKSILHIIKQNEQAHDNYNFGDIGWSCPWTVLILNILSKKNFEVKDLYSKYYKKFLTDGGIHHKNYRVRGISCYVLSII